MQIEIIKTVNLYKDTKGNKSKLIKRNAKYKMYINTNHISNPTEILDEKGNVLKNKCSVIIKDIGETVINKSYEEVKNLIRKQRHIVKGFIK